MSVEFPTLAEQKIDEATHWFREALTEVALQQARVDKRDRLMTHDVDKAVILILWDRKIPAGLREYMECSDSTGRLDFDEDWSDLVRDRFDRDENDDDEDDLDDF